MKLPRRRRLEAKTDYKARLSLLESNKPRLVVRKTNKYIISQIVISEKAQDKVVVGLTSKNLLSKGWPKNLQGSLKSREAAYLLGLMLGKEALKKKINEAILDLGIHRNIKKGRIYAVLKGVVEAGLKVPHSSDVLPTEELLTSNPKLRPVYLKMKEELSHE